MEAPLEGLGNKLIFFPLFINIAMTFLGYGLVINLFGTFPDFTSNISLNPNLLWQPPILWYGGCINTSCQASTLNNFIFWFIPSSIANAITDLQHLDILAFVNDIFNSFQQTNVFGSFLSVAIGTILLLLSFGLGGGASLFSSSVSVQVSDQGARFAQTISLVLFLLAFESLVFMNWITLLPPILNTIVFVSTYIITLIGGYLRALEYI